MVAANPISETLNSKNTCQINWVDKVKCKSMLFFLGAFSLEMSNFAEIKSVQ